MRKDISQWCRACLPCAKRGTGRPTKPLLTPIPVDGPFDRVGVDILKMPKTKQSNAYIVVFMDYLTKWPEAFATSDQTSLTIAKLLVERIISRHGVPHQLLSDRGPAFLSKLFLGMCSVLGVKKVNTTAYHPQTDGLVERFNRTLVDMLAKRLNSSGKSGTRSSHTRSSHTERQYRCPQGSPHSAYCMDVTPSCPQSPY